ncbi:Region of a membrane-bound protein predicted to be embedded in the membrane [Methanobacterium congolense]|jgi:fatty acid desaturase|uniref:Region of a membrane-bound protein predicted to be embedded in the membrane n=1 Tax=Methanobacterium congolense TaxID=118062 RepID=A0A1D3L2I7_9EURY|nr:Region of a membrane-bound protein predicted to be embedded in the membrane [Methanobacterium congolense]
MILKLKSAPQLLQKKYNIYNLNILLKIFGGLAMNEKNTGILMIVVAILLAILYLALPNFILYLYWIMVVILLVYGVYLFRS